jgi:galactose mutarotase-like enzyme
MITLENELLVVEVLQHGAELKRIFCKSKKREYLWNGGKEWKRHSPILFPNIGGMAGEKLIVDGKSYPALPHGFARDRDFKILESSAQNAVLVLEHDETTAIYYPYKFKLAITYTLKESSVEIVWCIYNADKRALYFSIGAHPGFMLAENSCVEDYKIVFDKPINIQTRRVVGRYLTEEKESVMENCTEFHIKPELFTKDALVLEDSGISEISLVNEKCSYFVRVKSPDFPVVALWTNPHCLDNIKYLCIEPWCGINSLVNDEPEDISKKERINKLNSSESWEKSYTIEVE